MRLNRLLSKGFVCLLGSIFLVGCALNEKEVMLNEARKIDLSTYSPTFDKASSLIEIVEETSADTVIVVLSGTGKELLALTLQPNKEKVLWNWQSTDSTEFIVGELLQQGNHIVAFNVPTNELYYWNLISGTLQKKKKIDNELYGLTLHGFSADKGHLVTSSPISGRVGFYVQLFDSANGNRFNKLDIDQTASYNREDATFNITMKPELRLHNGRTLTSGSLMSFSNQEHAIYGLLKSSFIKESIRLTPPEVFTDSANYYRSHIYSGVSAAFPIASGYKLLSGSWPEPALETGIYRTPSELEAIPKKWVVAIYDEQWQEVFWHEQMHKSPLHGYILSTNEEERFWSADFVHKNLIYQFNVEGLK